MPFFPLLASRVSPLANGVHWEFLDSIVHLIRNGVPSPACTSKVLIIGGFLVERQYASKVSWSQFNGTPLLSSLNARVSESRTLICISLLRDAALANVATNRRPTCTYKTAILRILIKLTPPGTVDASVVYRFFPKRFWKWFRKSGTLCSLGWPRAITSRTI